METGSESFALDVRVSLRSEFPSAFVVVGAGGGGGGGGDGGSICAMTHWSRVFGDEGNELCVIRLSKVTFEFIRLTFVDVLDSALALR